VGDGRSMKLEAGQTIGKGNARRRFPFNTAVAKHGHRLQHRLTARFFIQQIDAANQGVGPHATGHFVDQGFDDELGVTPAHCAMTDKP